MTDSSPDIPAMMAGMPDPGANEPTSTPTPDAAPPPDAPVAVGTAYIPNTTGTATTSDVTFSVRQLPALDGETQAAIATAVHSAVDGAVATAISQMIEPVTDHALRPGMQTSEGRLVFGVVGMLQAITVVWGALLAAGSIHPTDAVAAGVPGVAEALTTWLVQQYSGHRAAIKQTALASDTPHQGA